MSTTAGLTAVDTSPPPSQELGPPHAATSVAAGTNAAVTINMHALSGGASGPMHMSLTRSRNPSVSSTQHRVLPLPPPYTRAAWTLRLLAISLLVLIVLEGWLLGIMAWRQYKAIQRPPFAVAAVVATAFALVMHVYALVLRLAPRLSVGPAATAGGFWPLVFLVSVTMVSSTLVALQAWLTDPHDHPLFYIVCAVNVPVVVLAVRGFVWLKTVEMRVRAASTQSGVLSKGSSPASGTTSPVHVPLALAEEGLGGDARVSVLAPSAHAELDATPKSTEYDVVHASSTQDLAMTAVHVTVDVDSQLPSATSVDGELAPQQAAQPSIPAQQACAASLASLPRQDLKTPTAAPENTSQRASVVRSS